MKFLPPPFSADGLPNLVDQDGAAIKPLRRLLGVDELKEGGPGTRGDLKSSSITDYRVRQAELDIAFKERVSQRLSDLVSVPAKDAGALGFIPSWSIRAALPYQEPKGNPPAWHRGSGDFTLVLQPGYEPVEEVVTDERGRKQAVTNLRCIGYPYGIYPRLYLIYLATEVTQTKCKDIVFGPGFQQFMVDMGKSLKGGGPRGSSSIAKDMGKRLFSATFSVTKGDISSVWRSIGFRLAEDSSIESFTQKKTDFWSARIRLSDAFYESMVDYPNVPFDQRIAALLCSSTLALDIYLWLTYRAIALHRETEIPWPSLMAQFGSEITTTAKFKQNFLLALKKVEQVYPSLKNNYLAMPSGFILLPGLTPSVAVSGRKISVKRQ